MHCFGGPEPPTSFFVRTHPITSVRPKTIFGSVLERFGTLGTKKLQNSCFGTVCTFWGSGTSDELFRPNALNNLRQTQNDVWECFGGFRYVRHEKVAKLVFRGRMHCFWCPEPPTSFFARTHPITSVRPKTMFGSVLERFGTFTTKKLQYSCFGAECTVSGVWNLRRAFSAERTQ